MTSFKQIVNRLDNIALSRPLPSPVHNFSLFFAPMHDFYVKFDRP